MKKNEELVEIRDVPYINIDYSLFEGTLEDVSKKAAETRKQAKEKREKTLYENLKKKFEK